MPLTCSYTMLQSSCNTPIQLVSVYPSLADCYYRITMHLTRWTINEITSIPYEFGKSRAICQNFPRQYSQIHRNVYGIHTDCCLFAKFFLANSFYLHGLPKFPLPNISCVTYIKMPSVVLYTKWNYIVFLLFVHFDNSVYNGDVPSFNVEHNDLSYSDRIIMKVG